MSTAHTAYHTLCVCACVHRIRKWSKALITSRSSAPEEDAEWSALHRFRPTVTATSSLMLVIRKMNHAHCTPDRTAAGPTALHTIIRVLQTSGVDRFGSVSPLCRKGPFAIRCFQAPRHAGQPNQGPACIYTHERTQRMHAWPCISRQTYALRMHGLRKPLI